eukprot:6169085-Pyramimonas_sp.AAC.1
MTVHICIGADARRGGGGRRRGGKGNERRKRSRKRRRRRSRGGTEEKKAMPYYAMLRSATQRNAMLRLALLRYLRDATIGNAMTCFSLS